MEQKQKIKNIYDDLRSLYPNIDISRHLNDLNVFIKTDEYVYTVGYAFGYDIMRISFQQLTIDVEVPEEDYKMLKKIMELVRKYENEKI